MIPKDLVWTVQSEALGILAYGETAEEARSARRAMGRNRTRRRRQADCGRTGVETQAVGVWAKRGCVNDRDGRRLKEPGEGR